MFVVLVSFKYDRSKSVYQTQVLLSYVLGTYGLGLPRKVGHMKCPDDRCGADHHCRAIWDLAPRLGWPSSSRPTGRYAGTWADTTKQRGFSQPTQSMAGDAPEEKSQNEWLGAELATSLGDVWRAETRGTHT